jgi:hemolysin activation/secretion protein
LPAVRRGLAVATWLIGGGALAQVPPSPAQLPPSIDPGRIDERVAPERKPAPRPALPEVPMPRGEVPESFKSVKVALREVRIDGTSLLLPQAQGLASGYTGRQVTGVEIFELARAMTAMYRNAGYLLTVVVVPPQDLSGGRLTLRVVEGYIADVRVEGDPAVASDLAALGERIKASRPLHADDLERYLLLANDLPGVRVRAVLAPSKTVGAADLTLVATVKRFDAYASLDNYGSKYLGPGQFTVGLGANQLLGVNDQWRFVGITTGNGELNYGQLSYSQVVTHEGLRLGASVWQSRTQPGDVLEPFDLRGRADTGVLSAIYPVLRTRNQSVIGRVLFDARNITTDAPSNGTRALLLEDHIRALRLGATWLSTDVLDGQNAVDAELSQGVGGTRKNDPLSSRPDADGHFTKVVVDYERLQRLSSRFGITLGAAGQWTNEPLLTSEMYALGGRRFGRAYEPAELVGDRALAFRAEPAYFDRVELFAYQLYVYYDVAKVWYQDVATANTTTRPAQSLASAGFGTRIAASEAVSFGLELAKPLTRPIASYVASGHGDRARVLASVTVRF